MRDTAEGMNIEVLLLATCTLEEGPTEAIMESDDLDGFNEITQRELDDINDWENVAIPGSGTMAMR
ncbi:MAG: hypothetical protein ALECFALPRED_001522 [Alectoria fallacina]|uniref:Uncharacterized protein n=1 Tax=Alectoria fallacina TaxID=1903189 RepID=A0A8H3FB92_9LECA|nr:MAG: hypothetical protein ALECFALPRED_001522 [Alectoria fallacina]